MEEFHRISKLILKMKKTLDVFTAILIAIGLIVFLIFLGTKANLSFDASYNLLSYQSLFEGKGFVYDYDGKHVPFDPVISTGPELYLPVFVIWKIIGHTDYYISIYVLIAYYATFLGFLLFHTLKTSKTKTISMLTFIFLFLSNKKIFENYLVVIPLGELVVCFFIFAGIYFLSKRKLLLGFALLGLAIDVKTNIIIAIIPTIIIFLLFEFIIPKIKERNLKEAFKITLTLAMLSFLIFVPYLAYSKIIPSIVLNPQEKKILKIAQKERFQFIKNRGFGQILVLKKNFNKEGFVQFVSQIQKKIIVLKSWLNESYLLLVLFGILFIALTLFSYYQKHFSFYIFIFSIFMVIWWLFGSTDDWYRYFFLTEWTFSLGIVALIPTLLKKENLVTSVCISLAVIMLFVPQFSLSAIKKNLDETDKNNLIMMKNYIQDIDEQNIFVYGWFQCPQLMLLTNKRFQDYTNKEKLLKSKQKGREIFLLTTIENTIIKEEMEEVTKNFELIKAYEPNRLYKIR
jgi:hypothetical protein